MNVALLGYGTVGHGIHEILSRSCDTDISTLQITHILIRKGKENILPIMCDDIQDILNDDEVDIVVEVMGGLQPAYSYIMRALKAHKHVVTANKAVVAKHFRELLETAQENNVKFMFEASTVGGIPWIQSIQKVKRIDHIYSIKGIFNGTTNYILDQMLKKSSTFEVALQKAQELGYAERDPSADIDGIDIRNKLMISVALAFDTNPPEDIDTFGIRTIQKNDMEYFKSLDKVVKLIAYSRIHHDTGECVVEPILYPIQSVEANVPDNFNLACIYGETIGELKFYGQGAGKLPTANAVIQDMLDIVEDKQQVFKMSRKYHFYNNMNSKTYIIRCSVSNHEFEKIFPNVEQRVFYGKHIYRYIKNMTTTQAHFGMKKIRELDSTAFMASIKESI